MEYSTCKIKDRCTCCGEQLQVRVTIFSNTSIHHAIGILNSVSNPNITDHRVFLIGAYIRIPYNDKLFLYVICSNCQKTHSNSKEKTIEIINNNIKSGMKLNIYNDKKVVSCRNFMKQ